MKDKITVCQLSDVHSIYDDRIYWKYGRSLKKHGYEVVYMAPHEEELDFTSPEGFRLIGIPVKSYFRSRYLNKFCKILFGKDIRSKLYRKAKSLKAEVYHFHSINLLRVGAKLKELPHHPAVIYDPREPYYYNIKDSILKGGVFSFLRSIYAKYADRKEKRIARKFDCIIPNEDNVGRFFVPYVGEDKVCVIYNYSDLNPLFERKPFDKKEFDAIYCGNISRNRGAMTILETVVEIKARKKNFKVLFLGIIHDKPFQQEMYEYIRKNQLEDNVIIHDFVPYNQVHDYYLRSRIGLILFRPLDSYKIILPIKIFEYFTYGLPIICSNFGQIQEYTLKYNAGIGVDPEDSNQIAAAILELLENENKYAYFSDNAIDAAMNYFSWEIMEKKLIGLYRDVLLKREKTRMPK